MGDRPSQLAATIADLYEHAGLHAAAAAQHMVTGEFELDELNPATCRGTRR